jgi:hypothetical protein
VQGNDTQAATSEHQVVLAAEAETVGAALRLAPVCAVSTNPSLSLRIAIADLLTRGESISAIARELGPRVVDDQSRVPPPSAV